MGKRSKKKKNDNVTTETTKKVSKNELQKSLDKIKNKRKKLDAANHDSSRKKILDELFQEVGVLEKKLGTIPENSFAAENKIELTNEIIEKLIEAGLKEYNDSVQEMEDIIREEKDAFDGQMLSDEEIISLLNTFMDRKKEANQASVMAKRKVSDNKKMLSTLKKQDEKEIVDPIHEAPIKKEENISEEIQKTVQEMEPIHEAEVKQETTIEKEVEDPIHEADIKVEVEIEEPVKEEKEVERKIESVIDEIEFLYPVDNRYIEDYYPRILILNSKQYSSILAQVDKALLKVTGSTKNYDYVPDKVPSDLEHTMPAKEEELEDNKEKITLYQKKLDDKTENYADIDTLKKFGIFPNDNYIMIEDTPYYEIRKVDIKRLSDYIERTNNQVVIDYVELPVEEESKKEVEEPVEDSKEEQEEVKEESPKEEKEVVVEEATAPEITYNPSNINSTERFLLSLKGDENYNIIHSLRGKKQVSKELLDYLSGDLEVKANNQYQESLEQLSDEQLLKEVYENEDSDTLNRLDDHLLERLKNYILNQLGKCELLMQVEYDNLFYNIAQAKMLEKNLLTSDYEDEKVSYIQERRLKLKKASTTIQNIISIRENADYLLGKGILINIEKVFAEFPYIGMRYNKSIPAELESTIEESQVQLDKALKEEDYEGIITNYINLDSCYYEDMGAGNHIANSRSIGTKYYDILLNQFRYRDDELARKLLEEKALSSAEVHVASAEYIYDIKSGKLIKDNALSTTDDHWEADTSAISEDVQKLDDLIIEYLIRNSETSEVIEKLTNLENVAQGKLVETVNEIVEYLKKKSADYPELDVNAIQEKLEVILVHPEIISTKRIDKSEAMITYLSNIPKEALIYLILCASTSQMIKDVNEEIEKLDINQSITK